MRSARIIGIIPAIILVSSLTSSCAAPCNSGRCYQAQRQTSLRTAQYTGHYTGQTIGRAVRGGRPVYYRNPYWAIEPGYNFMIEQFVNSALK